MFRAHKPLFITPQLDRYEAIPTFKVIGEHDSKTNSATDICSVIKLLHRALESQGPSTTGQLLLLLLPQIPADTWQYPRGVQQDQSSFRKGLCILVNLSHIFAQSLEMIKARLTRSGKKTIAGPDSLLHLSARLLRHCFVVHVNSQPQPSIRSTSMYIFLPRFYTWKSEIIRSSDH